MVSFKRLPGDPGPRAYTPLLFSVLLFDRLITLTLTIFDNSNLEKGGARKCGVDVDFDLPGATTYQLRTIAGVKSCSKNESLGTTGGGVGPITNRRPVVTLSQQRKHARNMKKRCCLSASLVT